MNIVSPFGTSCSLSSGISLKYHGTMQNVAPKREMEMICRIVSEAERLHGWKAIDGRKDIRCGKRGRARTERRDRSWKRSVVCLEGMRAWKSGFGGH